MRTPAGSECKYFYGDYFRGREHEECRLLAVSNSDWTPDLCRTCPVPAIGRANACKSMELRAQVTRPLSAAFQRRVQVKTFCKKTERSGFDPHIGCGECHSFREIFEKT
jgi:hypothetical protein